MAIEFFGDTSAFGDLAGWEIQTGPNPSTETSYANALGRDGDEIRHAGYGAKTSATCTYVSTATSGSLTLPKVGAILNGYHVDSVSVAYEQTGFPTLTVTGHRHDDGSPDKATRTYSPSVELPAVTLGVPSELDGAFSLSASAECGMRSLTYSLTCTHVDEMDADGGHLAGENHDGVETLSAEFTGKVTVGSSGTDVVADAAWFAGTHSQSMGNTSATTTSLTLTRHIAHDAAAHDAAA